MFYTSAFGAPDMLFSTLLAGAREANLVTAGAQQSSGQAPAACAETYMAGLLLRDENFVPARVMRGYAHHYQLDFAAGVIRLRTELYAAEDRVRSLFGVSLEGPITGNEYVVRDAVTRRVLAGLNEEQILKPAFFSQELPLIAYRGQRAPQAAPIGANAAMVDEDLELQLAVGSGQDKRKVQVVKLCGEWQAKVLDCTSGEPLCFLPLDCLNNFKSLKEALSRLLPPSA